MSHAPIDPATVRRLVAEVVARLQAEAAAARPAAGHGAAATAGTAPGGSSYGQPQASGGTVITEKVLTLAILERLPAGTRHVTIAAGAVVTPSARDHAREAGIEIARQAAGGGSTAISALRPLVIGRADSAADAAGRCAAIARAVPGSQQLPATGLADAIEAVATHASRDGLKGVLLTGRPAAAVVLANRSQSLRAVTARDAAALLAAVAETAANLIVVNPKDFSAGSLERVCVDFARRDAGAPPAELSAAPKPCACQSH